VVGLAPISRHGGGAQPTSPLWWGGHFPFSRHGIAEFWWQRPTPPSAIVAVVDLGDSRSRWWRPTRLHERR
jgi:hypothetical protein